MHCAIYLKSSDDKKLLIQQLQEGSVSAALGLHLTGRGALYSALALEQFLAEEYRHGRDDLTAGQPQALASLSEGEQKRLLLDYLLASNPDYLILDNLFDSLDLAGQQMIEQRLHQLQHQIPLVQLLSRRRDKLAFIHSQFRLQNKQLVPDQGVSAAIPELKGNIPPAADQPALLDPLLISMRDLQVRYGDKAVLNGINWDIRAGEFWQLHGPNGAGKSTLVQLINGESTKGYGQQLYLFGRKKGSGESVWDIKKNIGCFTRVMVQNFSSHDSVENMLISGFFDSVGLYQQPSAIHQRLAAQWLELVGMTAYAKLPFAHLGAGQQRLILAMRAMVKHPPLLLLDEPLVGLDDEESAVLIALINRMASARTSAIVYISHRAELGLTADAVYELVPQVTGSVGRIAVVSRF
ncbi:ATP-binding cassette domain-containing protein [Rheinheimera mangrovi]|uniref:ATP-binding cassette domain-containing protein n=1 Tax=Rheinheimera mangrovi TaxID=2498451 RepID=UPI000F8F0717|nr:ATP-binding cassette domain-containing protein [Rheinheimera mangrovi]